MPSTSMTEPPDVVVSQEKFDEMVDDGEAKYLATK